MVEQRPFKSLVPGSNPGRPTSYTSYFYYIKSVKILAAHHGAAQCIFRSMNSVSRILCLVTLSSAVLITGCSKKPLRPDPGQTVLGPQAGGQGGLNPSELATPTDLSARDANFVGNELRNVLEPVYFDFDKASIRQSERAKIQAAKDYLAKNPQYHVLFEGHCDWRGTSEYNLGLGDRRAAEAKKYLISLGVSADKVDTLSKGSEDSKKDADQETMNHDRRAEIVILKGPAGAPAAEGAAPAAAAPATN